MAAPETREVRAVAKWVRMSPRKARLVTRHINGRSVPEARTVLAFTQRAAAREIDKVLRSAVANAEANHGLVGDNLVVSAAYVDEGPVMKRWRARARGRVARIKKPTCHITIKLAPLDGTEVPAPRAAPPPAPEATEEPQTTAPEPTEEPEAAAEEPEATAPEQPDVEEAAPEQSVTDEPQAKEPQTETKPKRTRAPRKKKEEEADS
jgi:large subunit ribosomal protein L22